MSPNKTLYINAKNAPPIIVNIKTSLIEANTITIGPTIIVGPILLL